MKAYIKGYNLIPNTIYDIGNWLELAEINQSNRYFKLNCEVGKTYTISYVPPPPHYGYLYVQTRDDETGNFVKVQYLTAGNAVVKTSYTFTVEKGTSIWLMFFRSPLSYISSYSKIQLVEGEEEKPYDNGRIRVKPVIRGETPKNLFDKSDIVLNWTDFDQCTERYLSEDKTIIIAKGTSNDNVNEYAWSKGWVKPCCTTVVNGTGGAEAVAGDKLTLSADITLLEYGGFSDRILPHLFYAAAGGVNGMPYRDGRQISTTKKRYSWTFTVSKDGRYYPVFCINSNRVQIENILITNDGDTNYYAPQKCNIFIKE